MNEENVKQVMESIFDEIIKNSNPNPEVISNMVLSLKEKYRVAFNPDEFSTLFVHKVDRFVEAIAEGFYDKTNIKMKDHHKPTFIFTHYDFLASHIEKLIEKKEGRGCSVDKSRHILNKYFIYALTGEVNELVVEKKNFWVPKVGSIQHWMEFCDSLYQLFYGNIDNYLISYSTLIQGTVKKFEYEEHKWYLEFIDGTKRLLQVKYDDRNDNPIDMDQFAHRNFVFVFGLNLGSYADQFDNVTEELLTEEEKELFGCFYSQYKIIPKNQIKDIYCETKKVIY